MKMQEIYVLDHGEEFHIFEGYYCMKDRWTFHKVKEIPFLLLHWPLPSDSIEN